MVKRQILPGCLWNGLLLAAAVAFALVKKSTLIIYFGVAAANIIRAAGWILLLVAFLAGNAVWLRYLKKNRPVPAAEQPVELSRKEAIEPEQIRQELQRFDRERPALRKEVAEALGQMDSMDRKQEKLQSLFQRNRVKTLSEVEATVNEAEQAVCRNLVKVINRMILWDPLEWNMPGKEEIYKGHLSYIRRFLDRNGEILSQCDVLLAETAGYIDEKDMDEGGGRLHLDVMTETIQSLRQINRNDFEL